MNVVRAHTDQHTYESNCTRGDPCRNGYVCVFPERGGSDDRNMGRCYRLDFMRLH